LSETFSFAVDHVRRSTPVRHDEAHRRNFVEAKPTVATKRRYGGRRTSIENVFLKMLFLSLTSGTSQMQRLYTCRKK
jgi:hypothetical protein